MRLHPLVAMAIGFALGVVFISGVFWMYGSRPLPPVAVMPAPTAAEIPEVVHAAAPDTLPPPPETSSDPAPPALPASAVPPLPEPARSVPPLKAAALTPDQTALSHRNLILPVVGVRRENVLDTFHEARPAGKQHEADDIIAPRGTPVVAVDEGNVVKLFDSKAGGLTVYQFDDTQTYCYYYAHLDHYAPGLKEGVLLRRGDPIGYVGSTGDASPKAPHLHFSIFKLGPEKHWWQGKALDPYPMLMQAAAK
jgi:peptidoglycan LD-endopeptidase LytH